MSKSKATKTPSLRKVLMTIQGVSKVRPGQKGRSPQSVEVTFEAYLDDWTYKNLVERETAVRYMKLEEV